MKHIIFTKPHGAVIPFIDNGKYQEVYTTHGKQSPIFEDGRRIYEGEYVKRQFSLSGLWLENNSTFDNLTIIESGHIQTIMKQRRQAVNMVVDKLGAKNCIHIEPHLNAHGNGKNWTTASGHKIFHNGKFDAKKRAQAMSKYYLQNKPLPTMERSIARKYFSGIKCESFLIEQEFMTNKTCAKSLMDDFELWTKVLYDTAMMGAEL